jgi:nucleoside 2-deoxyribosyltransferase
MSKPRIYLAGPINGLSFNDAVNWREEAREKLASYGIAAYSPMRSKDFLAANGVMRSTVDQYNHPLSTSKGIMARDHNDCVTADAILVNYSGFDKASLGTAMELAWAFAKHIPVVAVGERNNINIDHPMMWEAINFRVDTLAEGIELIRTIVLPDSEATK